MVGILTVYCSAQKRTKILAQSDPERIHAARKGTVSELEDIFDKKAKNEDVQTKLQRTFNQFAEFLLENDSKEAKSCEKIQNSIKSLQIAHKGAMEKVELQTQLLEKFKAELCVTSKALDFSQEQLNLARKENKVLRDELAQVKGD